LSQAAKATKQARQTPFYPPPSSSFLHFSLYSLACDTSELMLGNVGFFSHGMDMSSSDTPGVEVSVFFYHDE
jgi:hypothetical protein